jgi:hypothetical protein
VGFERFKAWKYRPKEASDETDFLTPQQTYAEWMRATFGPALRTQGLRGSGGRFHLPTDVYWAQLGFQKSAFSDGQEVRFTVNLSVIRRDVWAEQTAAQPHLGEEPSPNTKYGAWAHQVRIGKLTPDGEDKWWRIVRGVASTDVRDDAVHDLLTLGVPWLRKRLV